MRITALVKSPDHVCCRYRLAAFEPDFERAGHVVDYKPHPMGWVSPFRLRRDLLGADVVILQRRLLPMWMLAVVRRAARRLVYDFDDAVFLRDSFAPRGMQSLWRTRTFAAIVRAADAVVAGNPHLRDHACRWTDPRRVHVIRTCLNPDLYPVAQHSHAGPVRLVWIGSASTLRGLEHIRPLLEGLGQHFPGISLKMVCDQFMEFNHLLVVHQPWSRATEAQELAQADIGIAWMPDDPWSRGKCSLKVLQYMAAGLPVIANPVGTHRHLVRDGESGFLASTPEEWTRAVELLTRDPALRRRMGRAGRQRVEDEFPVRQGAARWLALLNSLVGSERPAQPRLPEETLCEPAVLGR